MVELTYTNANHVRVGVLRNFGFDLEFGRDTASNDFELTTPIDLNLEQRSLVYIDGTEYGGVIDGGGVDYTQSPPKRTYTGRSWQGVLARKVVMPEGNHFSVSGEANTCIQSLLDHVGDSDGLFKVGTADSGITITGYDFERFCTAYDGLIDMLASVNARLNIKREYGYVFLNALPINEDTVIPGRVASFSASFNDRPVNHLICAGEGEGSERVVVHLYADSDGAVSQTQSLFGLDEVSELYSFTSADEEQIISDGTKRLEEYQNSSEASMDLPEDEIKSIGDKVICSDPNTSIYVSAAVELINVSVNQKGITITPSLGEAQASTSSTYIRKV